MPPPRTNVYTKSISEHQKKTSVKRVLVWTLLEVFAFEQIFTTIFIKGEIIDLHIYFNILFCLLIFSFVTGKGLLGRLLNIKYVGGFMGKYCYSIYVMQWIVQNCIANGNRLMQTAWYSSFRQEHPLRELVCSIGFIIAFGVLTYYLVEKPAKTFLEKILLRRPSNEPHD